MRRGNTETISITEDATLLATLDIYQPLRFTIRQGSYVISKDDYITVDTTTISVDLTQQETLGFSALPSAPPVYAQVKWVDEDGNVRQTSKTKIAVQDTLDEGVFTLIDSGSGVEIR
jgi:hypothetical protein